METVEIVEVFCPKIEPWVRKELPELSNDDPPIISIATGLKTDITAIPPLTHFNVGFKFTKNDEHSIFRCEIIQTIIIKIDPQQDPHRLYLWAIMEMALWNCLCAFHKKARDTQEEKIFLLNPIFPYKIKMDALENSIKEWIK